MRQFNKAANERPQDENKKKTSGDKTFTVSFCYDFKFWSSGHIALNIHSKEVEIEFLCVGVYIEKA